MPLMLAKIRIKTSPLDKNHDSHNQLRSAEPYFVMALNDYRFKLATDRFLASPFRSCCLSCRDLLRTLHVCRPVWTTVRI